MKTLIIYKLPHRPSYFCQIVKLRMSFYILYVTCSLDYGGNMGNVNEIWWPKFVCANHYCCLKCCVGKWKSIGS